MRAPEVPEGCLASSSWQAIIWKVCLSSGCHMSGSQVPVMQKGRAAMHKNGVLNVLVGSDCEIEIHEGLTEETVKLAVASDPGMSKPSSSTTRFATKSKPLSAKEDRKPKETFYLSEKKSPIRIEPHNDRTEIGDYKTFFPYSILKDKVDKSELPDGVDLTKREQYLSPEEFFDVFGMEKIVFNMLPGWKRKNLKNKLK